MTSETFTTEIEGMMITVWMLTINLWAFTATRNGLLCKGSVNATNRTDAADLAYEQACRELWSPIDILKREG